MRNKKGVFYGVGVGPGDPELLTLKAWHLIKDNNVFTYPAPDEGDSFARQIVSRWLDEKVQDDRLVEIPIKIPMRPQRQPAQSIYEDAVHRITPYLDQGQNIVMLCEGDPLTYGTFMYMMTRLREHYEVTIIPGVSSIQSCASVSGQALAARNDLFHIIPAPLDNEKILASLNLAGGVAIIKLGRHFPRIFELLSRLNLLDNAVLIQHASLPKQKIVPLKDIPSDTEIEAPYFSMILIYKGDDPYL